MTAPSSEVEAKERVERLGHMPRTLKVFNRIDALLDAVTDPHDPNLKDLKRYEEAMAHTIVLEVEISEREYASWDERLSILERAK